jgi:hypothetical protein
MSSDGISASSAPTGSTTNVPSGGLFLSSCIYVHRVTGNSPTLDAPVSGGIVLASSESFGGSAPSDTVVRGNLARANTPADLVYDGSGQNNRLTGNGSETSVSDGLCR